MLSESCQKETVNATEPHDVEAPHKTGAHETKASWVTVGLLQIGDIVGTGILALGPAVSLVGWIPAAILLPTFLCINVYAGYILQEAFLTFPKATSFPTMAHEAVGKLWFTWLVRVLFWTFIIGILGQYVQVLSMSLQSVLVNLELCNYEFVLIGVIILLPLAQLRTLNDSRAIQQVNTFSITLCIMISVCFMWTHMSEQTAHTSLVNYGASWLDVSSALNSFAFAFMGNFIYLEFMAEMPKPEKFYKSFYISSPYQLVMYSLASLTQYGFEGDKATDDGKIFEVIPQDNPLYGIAAFLLLIHMLCAYLIKGTIVAREVHLLVSPDTVNDRTLRGSLVWFGVTTAVAFGAFVISSSIPNFGALVDLLASFQAIPLGLIIPPIYVVGARRHSGRATSLPSALALLAIFVLGWSLTALGIAESVLGLRDSFEKGNRPFTC